MDAPVVLAEVGTIARNLDMEPYIRLIVLNLVLVSKPKLSPCKSYGFRRLCLVLMPRSEPLMERRVMLARVGTVAIGFG